MSNFRAIARDRAPTLSLWAFIALSLGLATAAPSCLERRDEAASNGSEARCAGCHGDAARQGDYLSRAAPPRDLLGASDPHYPGVGAHSIHLGASATHAAIACNECHVVPEQVNSPGHADDDRPAEVLFGALAAMGDRQPLYDVEKRTCEGSYCHRAADAVWSEPRTSEQACGSCHGLPPAQPHPQSDRCSECHGDVIDAERLFIAPERHVDGVVDFAAGACTSCHGSGSDPAPPTDTLGHSEVRAMGVGAHQAHLSGGLNGRPLACAECHHVPEAVEEPTHADGLPAEVELSGVALAGDQLAAWDATSATCSAWCHSPVVSPPQSSPAWTDDTKLGCTSCHGAPPPAPHPQMANCAQCHGEVVGADGASIVERTRHVDGVIDVMLDESCSSCHGSVNPAPPQDLSGNIASTAGGVGAHQTHVQGTPRSRAVPCGECHTVPNNVFDPGHVDTPLPAELVFSGVAVAFGAAPAYEGASCGNTSCHGAVFPDGHASGGTNTLPLWTKVDGTQASCGSCHGLPPPAPHPNPTTCHDCHEDVAADDASFVRPDLHVDGIVTFTVP